jgi:1,4-alpha-glucan branching enzyme
LGDRIVPEPRTESSASPEIVAAQAKVDTQIDALLSARNSDPFALLGPQPVATTAGPRWVIRFFDPHAYSATISGPGIPDGLEARKRRPEGLFEATLPETYKDRPDPANYRIKFKTAAGESYERYDTYAFPFLLSEFDLYLMGEGRHYDAYEKLGAHITTVAGVKGVNFAVWAPSARRVSVVGDFNHWDGRANPMRSRGSSGIWELFVPELDEGTIYKYEIIGPNGAMLPQGRSVWLPRRTAAKHRFYRRPARRAQVERRRLDDAPKVHSLARPAHMRLRSAPRRLAPHSRRR